MAGDRPHIDHFATRGKCTSHGIVLRNTASVLSQRSSRRFRRMYNTRAGKSVSLHENIMRTEIEKRAIEMQSHPSYTATRRFDRFLNREATRLEESSSFAGMTQYTQPEKGLRVTILTGFGLVILLTVLIAGWSYYHITTLGSAAENLFIANYRSIQYVHAMEHSIENYREMYNTVEANGVNEQTIALADKEFRENLNLEFKNITEPGELEEANKIKKSYEDFLAAYPDIIAQPHSQQKLSNLFSLTGTVEVMAESLLHLNERAMFKRADEAKEMAVFARLSTLGIIVLLIGISIYLALAVSRRSLLEFRELDRAKSNFVATAAHELKNPLSSIKTSTGLLLDGIVGNLSEPQTEVISNIQLESKRLLTLVGELLDLARLETGTLKLKTEPVEVASIIESSMLPVTLQAHTAGVEIDIAVQEHVPEIEVDANKITWAITNVLSNAIRYSPRGSHITIRAAKAENEVWISVTDRGKGIAEEDLTRIFQKFVQVEERTMGGGLGSGLGLSIAQEIVQLHKGRIWATSTIGKGSTFTIALPIDRRNPNSKN